jgi:putative membrane protein
MELYNYIKSLHLIFVITWFAGLFYIVRLFVYQIEANEKPSPEREILLNQYKIMTYRLVVYYYMAKCNFSNIICSLVTNFDAGLVANAMDARETRICFGVVFVSFKMSSNL